MAISQEPLGSEAKRLDPETALRFPVGVASPLWFAFGAAAATASTWWWMTRWTRDLALECAGGAVAAGGMPAVPVETATFAPSEALIDEAEEVAEHAAEAVAEAAGLVIDPVLQQPVIVAPEPAPLTAVLRTPEASTDDLTRLVGIGPRLASQLAEQGVTTFAQIAAWNTDQLGEIDKALNLRGRAVRDAWVSQAKRLAVQP